jgi:hypothetical protein
MSENVVTHTDALTKEEVVCLEYIPFGQHVVEKVVRIEVSLAAATTTP